MDKWNELQKFLEHEEKGLSESLDRLGEDADTILFYSYIGRQTMALKVLSFMKALDIKEKKEIKEKRQAMLEKRGARHA